MDKINHSNLHSYIIVRNDIPNAHKAVQGAHAVIEYFKNTSIQHPSLVFVIVKDERKLKEVMRTLKEQNIEFVSFREPMQPYNNSFTALCTEPLEPERRSYLKKFQLLV